MPQKGAQDLVDTFEVREMIIDEVDEATAMRLNLWFDTYENDAYGVTHDWIAEKNAAHMTEDRSVSRKARFLAGKANGTFNAWVACDASGKIIGSTTPFVDEEGHQHLGSLYVDKDWQGKGVASQLIQRVFEWFDPTKPIELMVVTYNERAKAFYRKQGFIEQPGTEILFEETLPEIKMIRPAGGTHEISR